MCLKFFVTIFIFQSLMCTRLAYDYCSDNDEVKKLCGSGQKHTICTLDDEIKGGGILKQMVPMCRNMKTILLNEHNKLRDKCAGGNLKTSLTNLPRAARMRELIWDRELQFIASKHAEKCKLEHDKCRNTKRFKYSGQNLYYQSSSEEIKIRDIIRNGILSFENESMLIDVHYEEVEYRYNYDWEEMGHLTVIINEKVSRVGCGIAACNCKKITPTMPYCYFMTCNYDYNNINDELIYQVSETTASDCGHWGESTKSYDYDNLCGPVKE